MTLKQVMLTGLLATASYKLYKQREKLIEQTTNTVDLLGQTQNRLTQITEQTQTLREQATKIQKTKNQLAYKIRVFKQESQPHLTAIQKIWTKSPN